MENTGQNRAAGRIAAAVIVLAAIVLVGWVARVPRLTHFSLLWSAMTPLAAVMCRASDESPSEISIIAEAPFSASHLASGIRATGCAKRGQCSADGS